MNFASRPHFLTEFVVLLTRGPIFLTVAGRREGGPGIAARGEGSGGGHEGMHVHTFGKGLEGMRIPSDLIN